MITRKGGTGPAAKQFNVVCDVCKTPSKLFDPSQLTVGKARQEMLSAGWAFSKERSEDYCPRHAVLASAPLKPIDQRPMKPGQRVYELED